MRVFAARASFDAGPLPLAPGRERAVASSRLCEAGRLELAELFGVCFSMNTAINSSNPVGWQDTDFAASPIAALVLVVDPANGAGIDPA